MKAVRANSAVEINMKAEGANSAVKCNCKNGSPCGPGDGGCCVHECYSNEGINMKAVRANSAVEINMKAEGANSAVKCHCKNGSPCGPGDGGCCVHDCYSNEGINMKAERANSTRPSRST